MSELKITLRVKHEPNATEIQVLKDLIKNWCAELCLEKEELSVGVLVDRKTKKMHEALKDE